MALGLFKATSEAKKTFELKWAFMVKHKANGSIERLKSHLAAKGFTQSLWNQLSG